MKTRLISTFSLLVVLLASCASQTPVAPPVAFMSTIEVLATQSAMVAAKTPSQTAMPSVVDITPVVRGMLTVEAAATQTGSAPTAMPIATSRGPNLEATDPSTVSLASGQIHFVEFFRFT